MNTSKPNSGISGGKTPNAFQKQEVSRDASAEATPRLVIVGGFVGSGKTHAIVHLAKSLRAHAPRLKLAVTQERPNAVDTLFMRSNGIAASQRDNDASDLTPSRLDRFVESAQSHGGLLFVEGAGLGTEFLRPRLENRRGVSIAPVSVLVDPIRAARIFGLNSGSRFSDRLLYVYRKQLESADIIVISKADLMSSSSLSALRQFLEKKFPGVSVLPVSTRSGVGFEDWMHCILGKEHSGLMNPDVDPQAFAEGTALVGWLNCTVRLSTVKYFDGSKLLRELASSIQTLIQQEGGELGHLKMVLNGEQESGAAAISVVRSDSSPELTQEFGEPIQSGELFISAAAEADPELLHAAVNRGLLAAMEKSPELFGRMEHCEHFRLPSESQTEQGNGVIAIEDDFDTEEGAATGAR